MARPKMTLGEWGNVAVTPQVLVDGEYVTAPAGTRKVDRWRARTKVRDLDGKVRDVERNRPTKAAARRAVEEVLRERVTPLPADAGIRPGSLVREAAEVWRTDVLGSDSHLSLNTRRVYASALGLHIIGTDLAPGSLANLTVREVRVSAVERLLREVARDHGKGAAKMTRSVLRAVLDLAVKHDAIPLNPVRSAGPVTMPRDGRARKAAPRAFTREERDALITLADKRDEEGRDLGDLLAFMAGTGARIGEACALRWSALDLAAGTAALGPSVVRVKGEGLVVQEEGKSVTSTRTVRLPPKLVARLMARQLDAAGNAWDAVFHSPRGRLRDPSNTSHHVRELFDLAGHEWATAHTFRKTVATLLDEAGASAREAANQLGHARPSMTTDVYMSRSTVTELAATVL